MSSFFTFVPIKRLHLPYQVLSSSLLYDLALLYPAPPGYYHYHHLRYEAVRFWIRYSSLLFYLFPNDLFSPFLVRAGLRMCLSNVQFEL